MSEKLCALRKIGGGTLKETVLWTNPSPTSAFTGQTVTLSRSYTDFDSIKIIYNMSETLQTQGEIILSKDMLDKITSSTAPSFRAAILMINASYSIRVRSINTTNDSTQINFSNSAPFNGAGIDNSYCVPISIIGMR